LLKTRRDKANGAVLKQNERLKRAHVSSRSSTVCTMFAWRRIGAASEEVVGQALRTRKVVRSTVRGMAQLLPIGHRAMNVAFEALRRSALIARRSH
jgi:hypothetical protein